jgi:hypothetical protein
MEKIDRIIQIIREEMMTANAPSSQGGFGADSPAVGPRAGTSPLIKFMRRGKIDYRTVKPTYKKWVKDLENK